MCKTIIVHGFAEIRSAIQNVVESLVNESNASEECEFKIKLVLNELLTNSFKFAGDDVICALMYKRKFNEIYFSVVDNGKGFDTRFCNTDKMKNKYGLFSENGRGIYLVSCISEDLKYNKKGNTVLVKLTLE